MKAILDTHAPDVVIPIDAWNDVIALVENFQSIDEIHWIQQAQQARRDSEMVETQATEVAATQPKPAFAG